jgi:hypothetical protein
MRNYSTSLPVILRNLALISLIACGMLSIIASGGGGGEVIDLVPDPEFPFIVNEGVDTGDMNGDGLTDIVVAGRFVPPDGPVTGHIDIFSQDMSSPGSFLAPQRHPTNALPVRVKLADLNGDLLLDAVATTFIEDSKGTSFEVLLHDPMDIGQLSAPNTFTTVTRPIEIATGDIDRDGFVDIAIAGENSVAWHRQQANGSFGNQQVIGQGDTTLALDDLNADGLLDVVTQVDPGGTNSDVLIYVQPSGMTGVFNPPQSVRVDGALWMLATGDLNSDGRVDIGAAGFDIVGADFEIFGIWYPVLQTSPNPLSFTVQPHLESPRDSMSKVIAIGDLNGDGRSDVVIGINRLGDASSVEVFLQTNTAGVFRSDAEYPLPDDQAVVAPSLFAVVIADLNGDLLPDIAVTTGELFVLFQETGSPGNFGAAVRIAGMLP